MVPALGYLDKVQELLEKSRAGQLTNAEFVILQNQDLATLTRYEQARDLTITLLKKWLVEFKFKDWTVHRTDPKFKGKEVTLAEKQERAEQIARDLGDNKRWHSHGRSIGLPALRELRLEIDDYSEDFKLQKLIRDYNSLITEHMSKERLYAFFHSKKFF